MKLSAEPHSAISDKVSGWITNIQRFSLHDGPGIRSTVFFKGCQMRCSWCANPEGLISGSEVFYHADRCLHCGKCSALCPVGVHKQNSNVHTVDRTQRCTGCRSCEEKCPAGALDIVGEKLEVDTVIERVISDEVWFRHSGGGVTLSGGEVATQPEFAHAILSRLKEEGIHTAIETAGYASWRAISLVASRCDLVMYDLKSENDEIHKRYTGVSNKIILRNLYRLLQEDRQIIIRIPVIPGFNDSPEQASRLLGLVKNMVRKCPAFKGIELLPYHRFASGKYSLLNKPYSWGRENPKVDSFLAASDSIGISVKVSGTLAG